MMEIKLLKKEYKKDEQLFQAFVDGTIVSDETFYSNDTVKISEVPPFPVYINESDVNIRKAKFTQAFDVIRSAYIHLNHELIFDARFWHTLLVTEMRDYVIAMYPEAIQSESKFHNIVLKKFDWENYIYKCMMAVDYIEHSNELVFSKDKYYELIVDNLDVFNYIIKYPIFRNESFLIKILTIIDDLDISSIMKAKIKDRPDLGKDERYGRRVIFEMNKNYPVMMAPLMDIDTLKTQCIEVLRTYEIEVGAVSV